jgi:5-oxoprolinase (ATP-hydrolysing)
VWVDTGGTFTDCLARDPAGGLHRAKVLSSGAVRGHARSIAADRIHFDPGIIVPDGFFRAGVLRGPFEGDAAVVESLGGTGVLTLASEAPDFADGAAAEIVFDEEAPVLAARLVTGTAAGRPLPDLAMRLATTRGTNALLERRGAPVALFVTAGFGDLLAIGNQQREDLFALAIEPRRPLYRGVVEVAERLNADGSVLRPLKTLDLEERARRWLERGVDCAAVALLHAYRNPAHEKAVAALLRELGFRHVSVSSELAPRIQILPRAETAVVNAYLSDAIESYLEGVQRAIGGGTLHVMTSSGGLIGARRYPPKDSLLSGPAGGVVGAASAAGVSGENLLIAFDMGGTSTDVSRFGGRLDYSQTTDVGGARLLTPSLAIETVAAGGGSICWFDTTQARVGPESAGASPGPACYGGGGPLTLTDVNLLLGRVAPERFVIPLDARAAESAADRLLEEVRQGSGERLRREALLTGLLAIANERMAEAIRRISTRRGYGLGDHTLVAFGGAGGQHACTLASMLGMALVLVPVDAGILSAFGLRAARLERFVERSVLAPLEEAASKLDEWFDELAAKAVDRVAAEGIERAAIEVGRRSVEVRVIGQEATLTVDWPAPSGLAPAFAARYRALYGYDPPAAALEIESLRLVARSAGPAVARGADTGARAEAQASSASVAASPVPQPPAARPPAPRQQGLQRAWSGTGWEEWPIYERGALAPGHGFVGPALVVEEHSVTVVEAGWSCLVDAAGALRLAGVDG